jgi:hypothetical protein
MALYNRARRALEAQMRDRDPQVRELEIMREKRSLEEAIQRVESEVATWRSRRLKDAGVVDGTFYVTYDNGSIGAYLPEGTITFSSVDQLKDHLRGKLVERDRRRSEGWPHAKAKAK